MLGERIQTSAQQSHSRIKRYRFTKENSFNTNKLILQNVMFENAETSKRQRRALQTFNSQILELIHLGYRLYNFFFLERECEKWKFLCMYVCMYAYIYTYIYIYTKNFPVSALRKKLHNYYPTWHVRAYNNIFIRFLRIKILKTIILYLFLWQKSMLIYSLYLFYIYFIFYILYSLHVMEYWLIHFFKLVLLQFKNSLKPIHFIF